MDGAAALRNPVAVTIAQRALALRLPGFRPGVSSADLSTASGPILVRTVDTAAGFAALAADWGRLHDETSAASVFNSWLWQYQWWELYGAGRPLRILVATQAGQTMGILALYLHTAKVCRLSVRTLRAVGTGGDTHPDDLGPVLSRGASEAAVLEALAEAALRLKGWDVFLATDLSAPSSFARTVAHFARRTGMAATTGGSEKISYVNLSGGWDAFLASLKGGRRARIRKARRKLLASHAARFFVWSDPAGMDGAVDKLVELHRKRWGASGLSESFASREYVETHRGIMKSCLDRGWLRLYCLEVDGEIAAMTYCYRFRDRVFLVQCGYDPALSRFKPGHVLLYYALEHAAGEGAEVFDFLRGEHRYKEELANGHRQTGYVAAFQSTLPAWVYRLRKIHLPRLKARLLSTKPNPPR
jgi:CelD/BcsL family acetyltransferase involved in cellulose biosynthesis